MQFPRLSAAALGVACLTATLIPVPAGAQSANPPNISPIVAEFSFPVTTYDVLAVDPDGDTLTYRWTKTKERDCGDLTGANTDTFKWSHPHPPCPHEDVHPGTIRVVVSDGSFRCSAVYPYGSAPGTGPEPEPCTAISDPASVFCPGFEVAEGWFEPTQGVWQDDGFWADKPTKQLRRITKTRYEAELNMVKNRPTVITGIDHADDERKGAHARSEIIMRVVTTGSKRVPVRFRFSLTEGGATRVLHNSEILGRIPLLKPCGERKRIKLFIRAPRGVPATETFTFNSAGDYFIENELLRADTGDPTGMKVTLRGKTVETSFPTTSFLAATMSTGTAASNNALVTNTARLASESKARFPDYLPLPTGGMDTIVLPYVYPGQTTLETAEQNYLAWAETADAPTTNDLRNFKGQALVAAASSMFSAFAHLGRAGRMVVTLSDADLERINPWSFNVNGLAISEKVVVVQADDGQSIVAHELTHSIPHVFLDDQQTPCGAPNYHNKSLNTAFGLQLTSAGQPSRQLWTGVRSYMENHARDQFWIDQCTYWHLLKQLQAPIDPPVLLVRGRIALPESGPMGELLPSYEMADGVADLDADSKGRYAIVLRNAAGGELARYRFNPMFEIASHPERKLKLVSLTKQIPDMDGIALLELVGPNGILDTMTSSASTPTVTITAPRNNSTVTANNSTVNVSWTGSDGDGDPLLYTVMYSNDGGASWMPQVFETSATSATIQVSGTDHMVKVVATDGAHSSEATAAFKTR